MSKAAVLFHSLLVPFPLNLSLTLPTTCYELSSIQQLTWLYATHASRFLHQQAMKQTRVFVPTCLSRLATTRTRVILQHVDDNTQQLWNIFDPINHQYTRHHPTVHIMMHQDMKLNIIWIDQDHDD